MHISRSHLWCLPRPHIHRGRGICGGLWRGLCLGCPRGRSRRRRLWSVSRGRLWCLPQQPHVRRDRGICGGLRRRLRLGCPRCRCRRRLPRMHVSRGRLWCLPQAHVCRGQSICGGSLRHVLRLGCPRCRGPCCRRRWLWRVCGRLWCLRRVLRLRCRCARCRRHRLWRLPQLHVCRSPGQCGPCAGRAAGLAPRDSCADGACLNILA